MSPLFSPIGDVDMSSLLDIISVFVEKISLAIAISLALFLHFVFSD